LQLSGLRWFSCDANRRKLRWPVLSWLVREAGHEPRQHSRRFDFNTRRADNAPCANRPSRTRKRHANITLALARKEPHESGLSRDLLAMTSHNSGEAQGRLISPHSASGGLRRGRDVDSLAPACLALRAVLRTVCPGRPRVPVLPALRSCPIPHRELCDVVPSPEAAGRSRARPQSIPRCDQVTSALASWRSAFPSEQRVAEAHEEAKGRAG
jgi:hypothetical protein